jgi:hypothetical protein
MAASAADAHVPHVCDTKSVGAGGVTFREVMKGQLKLGETDPSTGYRGAGTAAITMTATVTIDDVRAFVRDPVHTAVLCADLDLPKIAGPTQSAAGRFGLFVPTADARTTQMRYELPLQVDGKPHLLRGIKTITPAGPWLLWRATTTLHATLHDVTDSDEQIVAAGILRLGPFGLLAMMRTMHGTGARPWVRTRSVAQFLGFFVGGLVSTYLLHRRA